MRLGAVFLRRAHRRSYRRECGVHARDILDLYLLRPRLSDAHFRPHFSIQAIKSLRSDDPTRKRTATIAPALPVLSLAPVVLYFGRMFF